MILFVGDNLGVIFVESPTGAIIASKICIANIWRDIVEMYIVNNETWKIVNTYDVAISETWRTGI